MTFVSNDPIWWPYIDTQFFLSYWICAAAVVIVYDWVLTLEQEIELIWRQHWSLMTVLYLIIRYIGILFPIVNFLQSIRPVTLTDAVCHILSHGTIWTLMVINVMLDVIMIARLHAMYQGSRTMLIFLVIILLAVSIACGVLTAIGLENVVAQELTLSGIHMCGQTYWGDASFLFIMAWMVSTGWELLALFLSVWIAVKHFCDLRRLGPSTGSTIGDSFRVLVKSHVLYFASFAGVSCLELIYLSPAVKTSNSFGAIILASILNVLWVMQMFVLGPRLILSIREYYAKLVAEFDAQTSMNSIVFQEHVHISNSSTV